MSATSVFAGFAVNLAIALLIVRGIYYPVRRDKNYVFTFLAFNTVIYFVMTFLTSAELAIGVGFGLFAIFSVLRYRTDTMSTRDMTYLFVLIALPVMNSVLMRGAEWLLLPASNAAVVIVLFVLERGWGFQYEDSKMIKYERIDLIRPEKRALLIEDIHKRTGLPATRVEIVRINLLEDTAQLRIYYREPESTHWAPESDFDHESALLATADQGA